MPKQCWFQVFSQVRVIRLFRLKTCEQAFEWFNFLRFAVSAVVEKVRHHCYCGQEPSQFRDYEATDQKRDTFEAANIAQKGENVVCRSAKHDSIEVPEN